MENKDIHQYTREISRLRIALVECESQAHNLRIWNRHSWVYPLPQAERIAKIARNALKKGIKLCAA